MSLTFDRIWLLYTVPLAALTVLYSGPNWREADKNNDGWPTAALGLLAVFLMVASPIYFTALVLAPEWAALFPLS